MCCSISPCKVVLSLSVAVFTLVRRTRNNQILFHCYRCVPLLKRSGLVCCTSIACCNTGAPSAFMKQNCPLPTQVTFMPRWAAKKTTALLFDQRQLNSTYCVAAFFFRCTSHERVRACLHSRSDRRSCLLPIGLSTFKSVVSAIKIIFCLRTHSSFPVRLGLGHGQLYMVQRMIYWGY